MEDPLILERESLRRGLMEREKGFNLEKKMISEERERQFPY